MACALSFNQLPSSYAYLFNKSCLSDAALEKRYLENRIRIITLFQKTIAPITHDNTVLHFYLKTESNTQLLKVDNGEGTRITLANINTTLHKEDILEMIYNKSELERREKIRTLTRGQLNSALFDARCRLLNLFEKKIGPLFQAPNTDVPVFKIENRSLVILNATTNKKITLVQHLDFSGLKTVQAVADLVSYQNALTAKYGLPKPKATLTGGIDAIPPVPAPVPPSASSTAPASTNRQKTLPLNIRLSGGQNPDSTAPIAQQGQPSASSNPASPTKPKTFTLHIKNSSGKDSNKPNEQPLVPRAPEPQAIRRPSPSKVGEQDVLGEQLENRRCIDKLQQEISQVFEEREWQMKASTQLKQEIPKTFQVLERLSASIQKPTTQLKQEISETFQVLERHSPRTKKPTIEIGEDSTIPPSLQPPATKRLEQHTTLTQQPFTSPEAFVEAFNEVYGATLQKTDPSTKDRFQQTSLEQEIQQALKDTSAAIKHLRESNILQYISRLHQHIEVLNKRIAEKDKYSQSLSQRIACLYREQRQYEELLKKTPAATGPANSRTNPKPNLHIETTPPQGLKSQERIPTPQTAVQQHSPISRASTESQNFVTPKTIPPSAKTPSSLDEFFNGAWTIQD